MITRIANLPLVETNYKKFLEALHSAGFSGEIEDRYAARLLCATDNSVYQKMPQAVVFPKSEEDVSLIFKLSQRNEFTNVKFAVRGGGTGTNGQSLSSGLIIDMSRHMKGVRDLDIANHSVWVQSGVIKDELNELVAEHNLFFSPELSTSSRATIGGMISNDAAGQGSLKYGRTSDHILKIKAVLRDGSVAVFEPVSGEVLESKLQLKSLEGEIYRNCYALLQESAEQVKKVFPKLNRFMTGYDLAHAWDCKNKVLNLARLICGAEGTLATVVEAQIDLTLKPTYRALCVIKYENFDAALRHANELIKAGAFSVETVDSKVLSLAKNDPVWLSVQEYIQDVPNATIDGVNIVEFNGYQPKRKAQLMQKLLAETLEKASKRKGGILGAKVVETKEGISAVYGMRKKAVGLLGSAAGSKKLVAFTEDTVVPPDSLADYILEFRALLDSMNVTYGMFGHVDTGLMHVRPALDLTTTEDRKKLIKISNEVVELVKKYNGQMWGEHGRGYRSCFGEVFFKELYPQARKIKAFFDPDNRLNPGKICVPFGNETDKLVAIDSLMRGDLDRTLDLKVRTSFEGALNCNGNGQCFSYSKAALMCPSYRYSKDHVKSPKGYSGLMREWLRLMQERNFDVDAYEQKLNQGLSTMETIKSWFNRAYNTICKQEDFNHEYLEQIKTCLACKSCKTQCPAHVNAAELNSRFLNFYYSRYLRPSMDLLCLNAEKTIPLMAKIPNLSNKLLNFGLNKFILNKFFKFVDLPKFNEVPLKKVAIAEGFLYLNEKEAKAKAGHLDCLIVSDIFTSAYEVDGLIDLAKLMRFMGFKVAFLKPYINGKLFVIRGARAQFIKYATQQAQRLSSLNNLGFTLVGFDPALTICYRDEYPALIKEMPDFKVLLPEEWIVEAFKSEQFKHKETKFREAYLRLAKQGGDGNLTSSVGNFNQDYYLFCHCTEQALVSRSVLMWQEVMHHFGLNLMPIPVACCGMAGLFGHMAQNQDESQKVYAQNWQPKIQERTFEQCLITGFSCRSQVARMEQKKANHPVHVLCSLLEQASKVSQ